ncbi:3-keto-disaccharide hydrolase [Flavivirga eckloniae]|uniref:DUF1080 domain-containing protein n=1 Tax=Flavivirga eckloniae TaxID=1803846 RepID=A0A2K9PNX1_9FLAO|nr:DUF1080 domain-containing protein [Flavivirga eckloniae]AUP78508.1 DUF1080 domain-containing protein [Flavivirga eckloniae]
MKKLLYLVFLISIISCNTNNKKKTLEATKETKPTWNALWNGKDFAGWNIYLGNRFNEKEDSLGNPIEPYGLNNDPLEVITVVEHDNENVIKITGEAFGMIFTKKDYKNYHLKLKVKWGKQKFRPRDNAPRDSGLLYHGFGAPGSAYDWMSSQELQIQEGDMGDYWAIGDVEIDVPSVPHKDIYHIYKEGADLRTYYFAEVVRHATAEDSLAKRRVFKALNAEKSHGEWNDIELITLGDQSIHIVNGKVVMRLYNSRVGSNQKPLSKTIENIKPLTSGRIILQSEGAELYYKDIYIKEITEIPEQFK